MKPPFLIGESVRFGWDKMHAHSALVFKVVLTILALQVANSIVQKVLAGTALGFVATVVLVAANFVLGVGATLIALRLAQHRAVDYQNIVPPVKLLWPFFAAAVLTCLAVIGGLILLVIPGIWVALRLSMVRFEVIEGAGIRESLHKSWEMTRGHALHLFLFMLALIVLNILGALVFLVGLLVSIPVTTIAYAHAYEKLKAAHHHHHHHHA